MCRGLSLSCQATGPSEMNNIKTLRTSKKRLMQNLCTRRTSEVCSCRSFRMYQEALELARVQDYEASRQAFENTIQMCPNLETAWVSWAQMEKRCGRSKDGILRSRAVLQKALALNPSSPRLCQAWGLLELQRGNWTAASLLIERAVLLDASLAPVLKWRAVETARKLAQEAHAAKGRPTLQSNAS
ncbi:hypothetical protein ACKKBF_B36725 [Auxenochlorella protothecoides x Auxenochlorella symbiontica]